VFLLSVFLEDELLEHIFALRVWGVQRHDPPYALPTHPLAEVEAGYYDGVSVYCKKVLPGSIARNG
jgi:hypothetical protein